MPKCRLAKSPQKHRQKLKSQQRPIFIIPIHFNINYLYTVNVVSIKCRCIFKPGAGYIELELKIWSISLKNNHRLVIFQKPFTKQASPLTGFVKIWSSISNLFNIIITHILLIRRGRGSLLKYLGTSVAPIASKRAKIINSIDIKIFRIITICRSNFHTVFLCSFLSFAMAINIHIVH